MLPEQVQVFNQAVQLANTGRKQEAYPQLKMLESSNPNDPNLILWLTFTAPNLQEAEYYLNKLAIVDPNNTNLASARQWFMSEKSKQPVTLINNTFVAMPTARPSERPVAQLATDKRPIPTRFIVAIGACIVVIVTLVLLWTLVINNPVDALRKRATEWGNALQSLILPSSNLDNAAQLKFLDGQLKTIIPYIEPSAVRDDYAKQVYVNWVDPNNGARALTSSIDNVEVKDGKNGIVRYSITFLMKDGSKQVISQETPWILIDGTWYRVIQSATIK